MSDRLSAKLDALLDELIPVAAYYRMSDDSQEDSIEQQQKEVRAWAARNGYRIVAEYVDSGKSGSKDTHKRKDFKRLLKDCSTGLFRGLLCYNTNRLGRLDGFDPDLADAVNVWRQNRILLLSTCEGKIDLNSFGGRLQFFVSAEMAHKYSTDLAAVSVRGRLDLLEQGEWPSGSVPFGYNRVYLPPNGEPIVVKRTEPMRKPDKWRMFLQVNEDERPVVLFIFDQIVNHDAPFRKICADLNSAGTPSPTALKKGSGKHWNENTLSQIVSNPAYCGVGFLGAKHRGGKKGKFSTGGGKVKAGVCPVIVDPEVFGKAQAIVGKRQRTKQRTCRNSGALSGVVVCRHCKHKMYLTTRKGINFYNCGSMTKHGTACRRWKVEEAELIAPVCRTLVERVDRAILERLSARPDKRDGVTDLEILRGQMEAKKRESVQAAKDYFLAPSDIKPLLEDTLRQLQREASEMEERYQAVAAATNDDAVNNFARWWSQVRPALVRVADVGFVGEQPEGLVADEEGVFWGQDRDEDGKAVYRRADVQPIFLHRDAMRALLKTLGITVSVSFKASETGAKKTTPGRGQGREFVVQSVRVEGDEERAGAESVCGYTFMKYALSEGVEVVL